MDAGDAEENVTAHAAADALESAMAAVHAAEYVTAAAEAAVVTCVMGAAWETVKITVAVVVAENAMAHVYL